MTDIHFSKRYLGINRFLHTVQTWTAGDWWFLIG